MNTEKLFNSLTPEEQSLKFQHSLEIKVKSVVLPEKHHPLILKTEAQVLHWLQNKIHNQHTAYYQLNNKYSQNNEQVSWDKNKNQNQRFLQTKQM